MVDGSPVKTSNVSEFLFLGPGSRLSPRFPAPPALCQLLPCRSGRNISRTITVTSPPDDNGCGSTEYLGRPFDPTDLQIARAAMRLPITDV